MYFKSLDHASPAQVMVQVFGSPPMEPSHPFLDPRMVGVYVLDLGDFGKEFDPLSEIYRPMGHASVALSLNNDGSLSSPVGTDDRFPCSARSKDREALPVCLLAKNRIGGGRPHLILRLENRSSDSHFHLAG